MILRRLLRPHFVLSIVLTAVGGAALLHAQTLAPFPAPTHPVACTNVETDASRLPSGVSTEQAWRGEGGVYVSQILRVVPTAHAGPLLIEARMPNQRTIFPRFANQTLPTLAIACYPTSANNPRPDYLLANGERVPHMQRAGEPPIFGDPTKKYPLLVLSHGLGGAPLDRDYLTMIKGFAGYGYIVLAPFHADQRFVKTKIGSFGDAIDIVRDYPEIAEAMAIRPVSMSQMLTHFLTHPSFKDHIEPTQIGGWGASLGGQTHMLAQGAKLTTSLGPNADPEQVIDDKRIKAVVGYVPYSGIRYSFLLSVATFGRGNEGVRGVRTPYLAITGSEDLTAPESQTANMIHHLGGSKYHVSIQGLAHTFIPSHAPDVFTWSLLFYRAHLFNDAEARSILANLTHVEGGANERVLTSTTHPWWYQDETTVVEYYHESIKHYFMTAIDEEKAYLDHNPNLGWKRTGQQFTAWRESAQFATQVFRFYHDAKGLGVNTHFFTLDAPEASGLRANTRDWQEERSEWRALPATGTQCAAYTSPVTRAYNNRFAFRDSNHRFMTQSHLIEEMRRANWIIEGNVMCVALP